MLTYVNQLLRINVTKYMAYIFTNNHSVKFCTKLGGNRPGPDGTWRKGIL